MPLKYPIGQQDFIFLRENDFVYIDKTHLIHNLVESRKYVFLARPRRFGKSLLLSTIQAYFEGKKELFKGLAIEKLESNWQIHPVLHLELSRYNPNEPDSLKQILHLQFQKWEKEYRVFEVADSFAARFARIIQAAYEITGSRVVILVDEYDNPIINSLQVSPSHEANRNLLNSIYSNLKALDAYIHFAMLTGVSRFSKMSVFSGLNNLSDITFNNSFSAICGITREEIKQNLKEGVDLIALNESDDFEKAMNLIAEWYDGYNFSEKCPDIYNPFSLLNALANSKSKITGLKPQLLISWWRN